jgi:hypothetical protein
MVDHGRLNVYNIRGDERATKETSVKVVGTGAPQMLTLRPRRCELAVLRDELEERRCVVTEAAAHAQETGSGRGGPVGDPAAEHHHDELLLISRLLDQLRTPPARGQAREVVGPTWLLGPVIRGAAEEAVERLVSAVAKFSADTGTVTPEQLRAALDAARACTATLIGLDYAENHAVDY